MLNEIGWHPSVLTEDSEALAAQTEIAYGSLGGGTTQSFFRVTHVTYSAWSWPSVQLLLLLRVCVSGSENIYQRMTKKSRCFISIGTYISCNLTSDQWFAFQEERVLMLHCTFNFLKIAMCFVVYSTCVTHTLREVLKTVHSQCYL